MDRLRICMLSGLALLGFAGEANAQGSEKLQSVSACERVG